MPPIGLFMRTHRSHPPSESGFTLAELLIVVVILGALASTVVVASGGFRDKGTLPACESALRAYDVAISGFRADSPTGQFPTTDAQLSPYLKATGGSTVSVAGTPEQATRRGKGWTFTVNYGATGATEPTFNGFTPSGCAQAAGVSTGSGGGSGSGSGSSLTCPAGQWTVSYWNITNAALPTGVPSGAANVSLPCGAGNRPAISNTNGSPAAGVNADYVVARWIGTVTLPAGPTTFSVTSDDGIRVTVNGTNVISNWTLHGATTNTGSFTAPVAGNYEVVIENYEWGGQWQATLNSP
jgi:prepilin-type N-terminal cleavage/methylation domain-containing protein